MASCHSSNPTPHYLKQISFNGHTCSIVTQNENGPCALLGLANVLILRSSLVVSSSASSSNTVSNYDLLERISDLLLNTSPDNCDAGDNYASALCSSLEFLAYLPWEMEVDVKFTQVTAFSPSPGTQLFSLLGVPLFHTWLVDPSSQVLASVIEDLSYVELNDRVITYKASGERSKVNKAVLAKDFLEKVPNQTKAYGLHQLTKNMDEGQLGVLFRNNHFATIYKKDGVIYQLVTDEGFLSRQDMVWETVVADGASRFVNQDFKDINENSTPVVKNCPKGHSLALTPTAYNEAEWGCDECWSKCVGEDLCFQCGLCDYKLCGQCYFKQEDATHTSSSVKQLAKPEPGIVSCPLGHVFSLSNIHDGDWPDCFACGWKVGSRQPDSTNSEHYSCPCPYFLCAKCYGNQKSYDGWMAKEEDNKIYGWIKKADKNKNSAGLRERGKDGVDRNENISVAALSTPKKCPQSHSLRCAKPKSSDWKCGACSEAYVGAVIVRFSCAEEDLCNFNMCGNCFYKRGKPDDVVVNGASGYSGRKDN